jgi:hypothetical protein
MAEGTYHTKANVLSKFKKLVFGSGTITDAEIEDEILRTESYVEGKIDPFYVFADITPVGTPAASLQPKSFSIVKEICLYRTIAKVNEILRKHGVENQNPEEKQKIINEYANSEKMLKGIALFVTQGNVDGALKLPDGTMRNLSTSSAAGLTSSVSAPVFKKDVAQW